MPFLTIIDRIFPWANMFAAIILVAAVLLLIVFVLVPALYVSIAVGLSWV